jgi:tetratricopeptide (TPR) repeat protein
MAYHHNCIIEEIVDELEETKSTNLDDIEKQLSTTILTPPIFETTVIVPVANHPSNKPRVHHHNKIILNLMIKNESNIIERCIGNSIHMVDAVSIHDTGSIDNTLEVCKRYLTASGKPFRISSHPFKTFGHNRTTSFIEAQELCKELEWDATTTYVLALDADMVLTSTANFKNFNMTQNGYRMIQKNGNLKYHNVRFMKCSYPWKCIGATHEYWSGDPCDNIPFELCYINDIGDGGCKTDKFERDIRLLRQEIIEQPQNGRAHFYLAQSYKDTGRPQEAITYYQKRIEIGGWVEEVWYSYYMIGKCYEMLKDEHSMELWMNKGFQFYPRRAENIYHLTQYFRNKSQHYKAYHYYLLGRDIPYPTDNLLFVEENVYKGLFEYENTILACYIVRKSPMDALCDIISYINKNIPHHISNVWDNLHWYTRPLTDNIYHGVYSRMQLKDHHEYKVSSCSIQPFSKTDPLRRYVMNTRYVNYSIDERGGYHMRSSDGRVKTKNGYLFLNDFYQPTGEISIMKDDYDPYPSNIEGLEDVRLFYHQGQLCFSASSKNFTSDGKIVIVMGDYIISENRMGNINYIRPPRPSDCEKNWIYVPNQHLTHDKSKGKVNFIYGWNPLVIGAVCNNQLEIHTTYETPSIFSRFRGSTTFVEYDDKLYAVVHFVKYSTPRCYYHSVLQCNKNTMKPEAYAAPFSFCEPKIEYCIGFDINDGDIHFFFSRNDTDPSTICIPFHHLHMIRT